MHVSITLSFPKDDFALGIFLVYQFLMVISIPGAQQVVEYHALFDDELRCLGSLLHSGEKYLPEKSQGAKCVFHSNAPTGYATIGYSLVVCHILPEYSSSYMNSKRTQHGVWMRSVVIWKRLIAKLFSPLLRISASSEAL